MLFLLWSDKHCVLSVFQLGRVRYGSEIDRYRNKDGWRDPVVLSDGLVTKKSKPMMLLTGRKLGVTDISDRGVNDVTTSNLVGQSRKAKGALFIRQCHDGGKEPSPISMTPTFLILLFLLIHRVGSEPH